MILNGHVRQESTIETLVAAVVGDRLAAPGLDEEWWPNGEPPQAAFEARCRARVARHLDRLPGRCRHALLSHLRTEQQAPLLDAWVANPGALTLALGGDVGVGKTYAAAAVANAVAALRLRVDPHIRPVAWWTVAGLLDALRRDQDDTVWTEAREAALLVLDDLAHTRPTEWAVERLWMLIDHRVSNGMRQVVTSNADWQVLTATWGAGTMDRLSEDAVFVRLTGSSLRGAITLDPR